MKATSIRRLALFTGWMTALGMIALMPVMTAFAADTENRGQLSSTDYKFAVDAAQGGTTEVTLGKLAADKATDPAIRQFAQHMIDDHGKAGQDLAQIASRKDATLPTAPSSAQQRHIDHLTKLSGAEFDKAYVSLMVKDHKATVKEFKNALETLQDADLKSFATTTLPVIEDHLKMAQQLEAKSNTKLTQNN